MDVDGDGVSELGTGHISSDRGGSRVHSKRGLDGRRESVLLGVLGTAFSSRRRPNRLLTPDTSNSADATASDSNDKGLVGDEVPDRVTDTSRGPESLDKDSCASNKLQDAVCLREAHGYGLAEVLKVAGIELGGTVSVRHGAGVEDLVLVEAVVNVRALVNWGWC